MAWPSLVEKAYAAAHGSYEAISGGYIAEALFDLSGFPTETIWIGADFDAELEWKTQRPTTGRDLLFLVGVWIRVDLRPR